MDQGSFTLEILSEGYNGAETSGSEFQITINFEEGPPTISGATGSSSGTFGAFPSTGHGWYQPGNSSYYPSSYYSYGYYPYTGSSPAAASPVSPAPPPLSPPPSPLVREHSHIIINHFKF